VFSDTNYYIYIYIYITRVALIHYEFFIFFPRDFVAYFYVYAKYNDFPLQLGDGSGFGNRFPSFGLIFFVDTRKRRKLFNLFRPRALRKCHTTKRLYNNIYMYIHQKYKRQCYRIIIHIYSHVRSLFAYTQI
jgi:hypothetical protein